MPHSLIDPHASKRRKVPQAQRKQEILALQVAGLTQTEIAQKLGVSRSSIVRDLEQLRPAQKAVNDRLSELQSEITAILPVKERAVKYAQLAKSAKNEAVSLGALQRIDDLDGIVTEKERIRAKRDEQPANQPMFVFQAGAKIDFGGVRIDTTTSREMPSLHNTPTATERNITATGSDDESK